MPGEFELLSIPAQGTAVEYDEEFISPETPIIPYAPGTDDALVSATRRILTAAADRMGREISWLRVYAGPDAQDRYGTALPRDTISALRKFRLGLLGPLATNQSVARTRTRELHRQVGLSGVLNHCATLPGRA